MEKRKIVSLHFPNYIREVEISKKQRPKYFIWDGVTIKASGKKLWQKCINPDCKERIIINDGKILPIYLKENYYIVGFKGDKIYVVIDNNTGVPTTFQLTEKQLEKETKYILCEKIESGEYEKVIANPTQVDKPNNIVISGQQIYSGLNEFIRAKIVNKIKAYYYKEIITKSPGIYHVKEVLNKNYPLIIEMEICDTIKAHNDNSNDEIGRRWDVGNRAFPYMKCFLDFLVNGYKDFPSLIEDDDRLHISSGDNALFTPIEYNINRKLIFHIYQDTREVWNKFKEHGTFKL